MTIVDFDPGTPNASSGPRSLRALAGNVVLISGVETLVDADKTPVYFVQAMTEGNGMSAPEQFKAPKHIAVRCLKGIADHGAGTVLRVMVEAPGKRGCHIVKPPVASDTSETDSDGE